MGLRSSSLEICNAEKVISKIWKEKAGPMLQPNNVKGDTASVLKTYLKFAIGPSRNLNNHVEDGLLGVGVERNVVEGGDGNTVLLDVDAVLQGVESTHLAEGVLGGHCSRLIA